VSLSILISCLWTVVLSDNAACSLNQYIISETSIMCLAWCCNDSAVIVLNYNIVDGAKTQLAVTCFLMLTSCLWTVVLSHNAACSLLQYIMTNGPNC